MCSDHGRSIVLRDWSWQIKGLSDRFFRRNHIISRAYKKRNKILKQRLGYSSYKEYLNSDLWYKLRTNVLKLNNYKCDICDAIANQVHHIDYKIATLRGEKLEKLIPLCQKCHKLIEFDNNKKLHIKLVKNKLFNLLD